MLRNFLMVLRKSDWSLNAVTIFLVAFGLMAIYSIEVTADNPDFFNFKKQLIFFGVGVVLLIALSALDFRYLRTYSWVMYAAGVVILLAVLVFGQEIRGTKGWFVFFGGTTFQPVEIIKVVIIITLGRLLYQWRAEVARLKHLFIFLGLTAVLMTLILLQPDFGSSFMVGVIALGLLLVVRTKRAYLAALAVGLVVIVGVAWMFLLADYQKDRVMTFLEPNRDPYNSGYNIKQSIIAVGSGNVFGRGLALGPQSRLNFLPAQETDFIFAVIAEELGLVGALLILGSFTVLLYRMVRIARFADDDFGRFLLSGFVIYFLVQAALNIGMNMGLMPVAGLPLPLVSYGGSSLIVSLSAVGIAQSVYVHRSQSKAGAFDG